MLTFMKSVRLLRLITDQMGKALQLSSKLKKNKKKQQKNKN